MATPLFEYMNGRLLLATPGERGGPETGYKRSEGQKIVVDLFLKQVSPEKRSVFKQITTASVASDFLQGYIVGFAALPDDEDWISYDAQAAEDYDESGKRPDAMYKGGNVISLLFGSRTTMDATIVEASGIYDDSGIGLILRNVLGDRIIINCEWRQ